MMTVVHNLMTWCLTPGILIVVPLYFEYCIIVAMELVQPFEPWPGVKPVPDLGCTRDLSLEFWPLLLLCADPGLRCCSSQRLLPGSSIICSACSWEAHLFKISSWRISFSWQFSRLHLLSDSLLVISSFIFSVGILFASLVSTLGLYFALAL